MARFSPVMDAVAAFAQGGGPVIGICNGFQVLCEKHLEAVADPNHRVSRLAPFLDAFRA